MRKGHPNGNEEHPQLSALRRFVRSALLTSKLGNSLGVWSRVSLGWSRAGGHVVCLRR